MLVKNQSPSGIMWVGSAKVSTLVVNMRDISLHKRRSCHRAADIFWYLCTLSLSAGISGFRVCVCVWGLLWIYGNSFCHIVTLYTFYL